MQPLPGTGPIRSRVAEPLGQMAPLHGRRDASLPSWPSHDRHDFPVRGGMAILKPPVPDPVIDHRGHAGYLLSHPQHAAARASAKSLLA